MKSSSIILIVIVSVLAVVLIITGIIFLFLPASSDSPKYGEGIPCTADAMLCPDGSSVGRDPNNNCQFFTCPENNPPMPIGGQRDEFGCLGAAGYSYNESLGVCVRQWEISPADTSPIKEAVGKIGKRYSLTVIDVQPGTCTGCFTVLFSDDTQNQTDVKIGNWTTAPDPDDYTCPTSKYINCMPGPGSAGCVGPYFDWLRENCDIEFAY